MLGKRRSPWRELAQVGRESGLEPGREPPRRSLDVDVLLRAGRMAELLAECVIAE